MTQTWFRRQLRMLGHLSFGVSDLERAIAFYDAALAPLGLTRVWTKPNAAGNGPPGGGDLLALKKQSSAASPGPDSTLRSMPHRTLRWTPSIPKHCEPVEGIMVVLGFDRITDRPTTPPS
jgi:catechol 2,3-dioxygenase-like lactoylglutathione lyase family enzyme